MYCPSCQNEAPGSQTTCPHCGTKLIDDVALGPLTQSQVDDQARRLNIVAGKSKKLLLWVAAGAAIILIAIVGYSALQARAIYREIRSPLDSALIGDHVSTVTAPGGSSLGSGDQSRQIQSYIQFMEEIEQRRTALRQALPAAVEKLTTQAPIASPPAQTPVEVPPISAPDASSSFTTSGGSQAAPQGFAEYQQQWQDLIRDFNAQSPPQSADTLSSNYFRVLQDYVTMLGQMSAQPGLTSDAASKIQADSQTKITPDALTADLSLQQLCNNISVQKTFSIASEITPPASPAPVPSGLSPTPTASSGQ